MSEPTVLWERLPVDHPVTFGFGETSPPYSVAAPHRGCDYAVPVGTPVYAPAAGIVHLHVPGDGYGNGSFGNHILIDHGDGWPTLLAHLLSFTGAGAQGATVKAGDLIAYSGNTGTSTGPHLHAQRDCKGGLTVTFSDCRDPQLFMGEPMGMNAAEQELIGISTSPDKAYMLACYRALLAAGLVTNATTEQKQRNAIANLLSNSVKRDAAIAVLS
jgi:hypothetical protein